MAIQHAWPHISYFGRRALYLKMERTFRDITPQRQFELTLNELSTAYGKLLAAEYTHNIVSAKTYFDGQMRPLRKFYYAVSTSKYQRGEYYLTVEVVPDEGELGVTGVYFVTSQHSR